MFICLDMQVQSLSPTQAAASQIGSAFSLRASATVFGSATFPGHTRTKGWHPPLRTKRKNKNNKEHVMCMCYIIAYTIVVYNTIWCYIIVYHVIVYHIILHHTQHYMLCYVVVYVCICMCIYIYIYTNKQQINN